jgi:hypothetical protein
MLYRATVYRAAEHRRQEEDIYDPFYGGREFSIHGPNGYVLLFYWQAINSSNRQRGSRIIRINRISPFRVELFVQFE